MSRATELADATPWEARRWCNGDDDWTNWQPCTAEQKARWEAGGDFEFRAALTSSTGDTQ